MTDFPTFPTPAIYLRPEKGRLAGGASQYRPSQGESPPPPGLVLSFIYLLQKSAHKLNTRAVKAN